MALEGAGSVSEINLREMDLVNLPMAILWSRTNIFEHWSGHPPGLPRSGHLCTCSCVHKVMTKLKTFFPATSQHLLILLQITLSTLL
jgi:hypothetical protein